MVKTASCFQRCVGMDAFNAVYSTTFECDKAHGTNYHDNFVKYLTYIQENDLVVDGAMTDPKEIEVYHLVLNLTQICSFI